MHATREWSEGLMNIHWNKVMCFWGNEKKKMKSQSLKMMPVMKVGTHTFSGDLF